MENNLKGDEILEILNYKLLLRNCSNNTFFQDLFAYSRGPAVALVSVDVHDLQRQASKTRFVVVQV